MHLIVDTFHIIRNLMWKTIISAVFGILFSGCQLIRLYFRCGERPQKQMI